MAKLLKPFKIAENLYFAGTYEASAHLLATSGGLILFDAGYPETANVIINSAEALGFNIKDLKYIIISHGHIDHLGGVKKLVSLTGAKTFIGAADKTYADGSAPLTWAEETGRVYNEAFIPDVLLQDGDTITLGNTEIKCISTPGHTPGTFSFFFNITENGKALRVGTFGGTGINSLKKAFLDKYSLPYSLRKDYFDSIDKLMNEKVDIFLGNHAWQNNTPEKYEQSLVSHTNPFIDSFEWTKFLKNCRSRLIQMMQEESRNSFINYAHRGASEYAPENTFLSFYLGILMGAEGIETDVQLTKDGIPVLFHDDTLLRVTEAQGSIKDYTFSQLRELNVKNRELSDKIVSLEDFLLHFSFRSITFAIELKVPNIEEKVINLLNKYNMKNKTVITSFEFENIKRAKTYDKNIRTGYLTTDISDNTIQKLLETGVDEICPKASDITVENVNKFHRLGLNVRAWGVSDEILMKHVYNCGADGMTVNFPDKLTAYINAYKNH